MGRKYEFYIVTHYCNALEIGEWYELKAMHVGIMRNNHETMYIPDNY